MTLLSDSDAEYRAWCGFESAVTEQSTLASLLRERGTPDPDGEARSIIASAYGLSAPWGVQPEAIIAWVLAPARGL